MIAVRLPNIADALERRLVADVAAQRIAGIRGVDDHPAAAQYLDGLAYETPLRRDRMQLQIDAHFVGYDTRMNLILELSPLIVFFVGFKLLGIYWATAALMIGFLLQLVVHRLRTGEFKTMHIITTVVAVGLGSATLLLHDSRFIQWKPTVLLAMAAAAFLGSMFVGKQPFARRMLESAFNEPLDVSPRAWWLINCLWAGWLALLAMANIYVARNFDERIWVNFKVFGITGAMLLFMVPQVFWLSGKTKAALSDPGPGPGL
jgi:intracellular septation protein